VRLFELDEVDGRLSLVPMAARRALDLAGHRLPLKSWQNLPLDARQRLAELGSEDRVDVDAVGRVLSNSAQVGEPQPPASDADPNKVPRAVSTAFGETRPIPDATWAALSPLERFVLTKVAARGRTERLEAAYREIIGASALSSHLEASGGVRMVNVGAKPETRRTAVVRSRVSMNQDAFRRLSLHQVPKGDVLATARLAGIMAAKRTSEWIPLCHPLRVTRISIDLKLSEQDNAVDVEATVEAFDRTGVEMEALVAASASALTVYDMLKSFDRSMQIGPTRLVQKSGGRSGDFKHDAD